MTGASSIKIVIIIVIIIIVVVVITIVITITIIIIIIIIIILLDSCELNECAIKMPGHATGERESSRVDESLA